MDKKLIGSDPPESGHSWRFWRRLSARGRHEHKSRDRPEVTLLQKEEVRVDACGSVLPPHSQLSKTLPDVVEDPLRLPRFIKDPADGGPPRLPRFSTDDVPPPKPPRLFIFRSSGDKSDCDNPEYNDPHATYLNCERVTDLRAQVQALSADVAKDSVQYGDIQTVENNNLIHKSSNINRQKLHNVDILCINNNLNKETHETDNGSLQKLVSTQKDHVLDVKKQSDITLQKQKVKTPELRSKRHGRSRGRLNYKGEMTRQRRIMNNIGELVEQRLDPYPLLARLKKADILNDSQIQMYLAMRERRSVCENLVDFLGDGPPELIPAFCDVLACTGHSTEILEILQVMREMDRIINDVQCPSTDSSILEEEKNITFDIGYLSNDLSLKPLVELERVRASCDKRLSKASSRVSAYSLLEGDSENCQNGVYPGLVMMSICVTGHDLSGPRAEALSEMIKGHNCISQLLLGKTQLSGKDICVIAKGLEANRTVHSLDLRLNSINQIGAEALSKLLCCTKSLRYLNLSSTNLNSEGIRTISSAIASNRTLVDLDLSFLDTRDDTCCYLRDMLRSSSSLQKLRLRNNNITSTGCSVLAQGLSRNRTLGVLDLSRNNIGNEGMQALVKFLPESNCSELCLENCGLTGASCDSLAELIICTKKLRLLDISTNLLLDTGICKLVPALERTSNLESLGVNMCGITNDGFSRLLDMLEKNASICHVKLCYNRLGRDHTNPAATSENLRYRLKIVTSSKPKLKILLWGNAFETS